VELQNAYHNACVSVIGSFREALLYGNYLSDQDSTRHLIHDRVAQEIAKALLKLRGRSDDWSTIFDADGDESEKILPTRQQSVNHHAIHL
jgi:hypothetical protein